MRRIVITGPESTGKSELTKALANHFMTSYAAEYAREFVEQKEGKYTLDDVLHIARHQQQEMQDMKDESGIVFFDTWLIITKVWLEVVYNDCPEWIDEAIRKSHVDLFLLCSPDIPWTADPVRENGGEMRVFLFNRYKEVLENYHCSYRIISGTGEERIRNAIFAVEQHLSQANK